MNEMEMALSTSDSVLDAVLTIERGQELVGPGGDTVLQGGDRLVVIGKPEDIDVLKAIASGSSKISLPASSASSP